MTVRNLDEKVREETISKLKFLIHDICRQTLWTSISYLTVNIKTENAKKLAQMIKK